MSRSIEVVLGERSNATAVLRFDATGRRESTAFEYQADWLKSADAFAIEPALPLVSGPQYHRGTPRGSVFHGAIADTEPDGWARRVIIRDHAKRRHAARKSDELAIAPALTSLDFLLAVDDASRVGALRFRDETGVLQRTAQTGHRTAPPLIELPQLLAASKAFELDQETAQDLDYLRGRATSLGGIRPKCTVIDARGRLAIGKFPSTGDDRAIPKGEVLALHLAAMAGIESADSQLLDSDGTSVALIRRFDRDESGRRRMYLSAATMLGIEVAEDGEHCYTEIVETIRVHGNDVTSDLEELWRRIAFSILITNVDDHLRNHGFLYVSQGRWQLSPAFDINPFPGRVRELKTWVSEDSGPEATIEALMSAVPYFGLTLPRARDILRKVEVAVASWRTVGRNLGLTAGDLEAFETAFEHPERAAARKAVLNSR